MPHFLDLRDISTTDIIAMLAEASRRKRARGAEDQNLGGKSLAMIFEKHSTRTRVSFEVAMRELGGSPVVLQKEDLQLGRGETVADTARVMSRYVDAIMLRCHSHDKLKELADNATVPVINGLTEYMLEAGLFTPSPYKPSSSLATFITPRPRSSSRRDMPQYSLASGLAPSFL